MFLCRQLLKLFQQNEKMMQTAAYTQSGNFTAEEFC